MKERYEKELRETRESARESCETLKSELAQANEEAAAARARGTTPSRRARGER